MYFLNIKPFKREKFKSKIDYEISIELNFLERKQF